jgi:hypothetical protein
VPTNKEKKLPKNPNRRKHRRATTKVLKDSLDDQTPKKKLIKNSEIPLLLLQTSDDSECINYSQSLQITDNAADLNQARELVTNYKGLTPEFQEWVLKAITMGMNSDKDIF